MLLTNDLWGCFCVRKVSSAYNSRVTPFFTIDACVRSCKNVNQDHICYISSVSGLNSVSMSVFIIDTFESFGASSSCRNKFTIAAAHQDSWVNTTSPLRVLYKTDTVHLW